MHLLSYYSSYNYGKDPLRVVFSVFSCDFQPEELPSPPDPRLLLPGQRYASQQPVGTSGGDIGAFEQTRANNCSPCTAEGAARRFIGEEGLDTRESERGHDHRNGEDSRGFSEIADQNGALRGTGDPFGVEQEILAQQRQQQMNLESLYRAVHGQVCTSLRMQEEPQRHFGWGLSEATQQSQQSNSCMSETLGSLRCGNLTEPPRSCAVGFPRHSQPHEPQQREQQQHRQRQDEESRRDRSPVPPFIRRKRLNAERALAPTIIPRPPPSASHLPHEPCTSTYSAPGNKLVKVEKLGSQPVDVKAEKTIGKP